MEYSTLIYRVVERTGVITLNRPERMNAVIEDMYLDLQNLLSLIKQDPVIRTVILTGTIRVKEGKSRQIFCAGADLKEHAAGTRSLDQKKKYLQLAHETCRQIFEFPKPTLAVLNGAARGAGTELALNCDFILMADDATLAFPETSLGTCIGGGASKHLVSVLGLSAAKDLIYTGRVINGVMASSMGLAHSCFPMEVLMDKALTFARELSSKAPLSMAHAKRLLHQSMSLNIIQVLDSETEAILDCMKTEDWHEGVRAFSQQRTPLYKGH
ncbi:MAG: enoyl-CoA hydratase/isomerase family protein [Proteobacteria bacterium]|nr:enoyl-CoA hydratase/isomerase family protein [Pseudomonadota bacterium]